MKETFAVLNQMVKDAAIENYAVIGAVGAIRSFMSSLFYSRYRCTGCHSRTRKEIDYWRRQVGNILNARI